MKTDTLIDMLARNAGPAPRALAARRLSPAALVGLLVSALAAITWFGAIPAQMFATAVPWTKMAYAGALAMAAGWLTARLSRPAAQLQRPQRVTVAVVVVMAVVGGASLVVRAGRRPGPGAARPFLVQLPVERAGAFVARLGRRALGGAGPGADAAPRGWIRGRIDGRIGRRIRLLAVVPGSIVRFRGGVVHAGHCPDGRVGAGPRVLGPRACGLRW
jgi:hypothetical protein